MTAQTAGTATTATCHQHDWHSMTHPITGDRYLVCSPCGEYTLQAGRLHQPATYDPRPCYVAIDPNDPEDSPTYPGWEDGSVVNSWPVVYVERATLDRIALDMAADAGITLAQLLDPAGYDMASIVMPGAPARVLANGTGLYSLVGLTTTVVAGRLACGHRPMDLLDGTCSGASCAGR